MQIFYNFLKFLQKSLMSTFVVNVSPNRNFGDAIAIQDLRGNFYQYEIFFDVPSRTKILEPPLYTVQYIPGT